MPQHLWITGGRRADRERAVADLRLPAPLLPAVDAHRRLRGPYTAAGAVVRPLVGRVLDPDPGRLTLVICSRTRDLPGGMELELAGEVGAVGAVALAEEDRAGTGAPESGSELAWEFVRADGTADDPAAISAYEALDPGERAR